MFWNFSQWNDQIREFVVSSKEEVGAPDCFCLDSVDYGNFLEDDGKIYGYQMLKVTFHPNLVIYAEFPKLCFRNLHLDTTSMCCSV